LISTWQIGSKRPISPVFGRRRERRNPRTRRKRKRRPVIFGPSSVKYDLAHVA
jgi:hypothetical protein